MSYAEERLAATLERERTHIPDPKPAAPRVYKYFSQLSDEEQCREVEAYLRENPEQLGLIGEAMNEHRLSANITRALCDNNKVELGELASVAAREYIGRQIQRLWDAREAD